MFNLVPRVFAIFKMALNRHFEYCQDPGNETRLVSAYVPLLDDDDDGGDIEC